MPPANTYGALRSKTQAGLVPQIGSLVLIVLVAFWYSLDGAFHFDDQAIFLDPYIVSSGFGWKILRLMQTRPLTFLTFHWNFLAAGARSWDYHAVNIGLHAINSVVVLLILRRKVFGFAAWAGAALFAIHPLQSQAVNYVFERATLLACLFTLLSCYTFFRESTRGR